MSKLVVSKRTKRIKLKPAVLKITYRVMKNSLDSFNKKKKIK